LTREPAFCPANSTCSELGSIYHSTPFVTGTPKEYLRDESYANFAVAQSKRPLMLYTATTDGQLHAFKVSANDSNDLLKVDSLKNNELLEGATFRQELDFSFDQMMRDIVPINIKDESQFINEETMHAITLVIQPNYSYKMYYSSLNHFRENIVSLFKEVKADYVSKYA
jgi:hypothetical protein